MGAASDAGTEESEPAARARHRGAPRYSSPAAGMPPKFGFLRLPFLGGMASGRLGAAPFFGLPRGVPSRAAPPPVSFRLRPPLPPFIARLAVGIGEMRPVVAAERSRGADARATCHHDSRSACRTRTATAARMKVRKDLISTDAPRGDEESRGSRSIGRYQTLSDLLLAN